MHFTISERTQWNIAAWLMVIAWYNDYEIVEALGPRPEA